MTARSHRSLRCAAAAAWIGGVTLSPAVARAQAPTGDSMAVAEALFRQARDLFKENKLAEACPKFAESHRLDPKLGTLLNLAVCNEKLGKTASAWAEYSSAAAIARREGQKEREEFAREQVAILEKKLARIVIQVAGAPPGLKLTWDDQPLDAAVLGTPVPVDPGSHKLSASAPSRKAWYGLVNVSTTPGQFPVAIPALEVEIPPPTPVPVPVAPPAVGPVAPPPQGAPDPGAAKGSDTRPLVYIGFSVGGAGVLVGAITGVVAIARGGALHTDCTNNHCTADKQGRIDAATAIANASNVSFALGAAGIVAGVAGLLLAKPDAPPPRSGLTLTPIVGPGALGLRGSF
jgi:hypothetical protein